MGLNIKKSFKVGNLLKVNKNKSGLSVSVGNKNFRLTLNDKDKLTASLPGTGISYDTNIGSGKKPAAKKKKTSSSAKKPAASAKKPASSSAKKPVKK